MKFDKVKNIDKNDFINRTHFRIQPKFYIECKNCGRRVGSDDFSFLYFKAEEWFISEDYSEFICKNCGAER